MDEQPFFLEIQTINGIVVLTPDTREINFKNTREFLKRVKSVIIESDPVPPRFVLDMRRVEIIDSVSLGTLIALLKYARTLNSDIVVASISEPIRTLFELLHFDNIFKIYESLDDALKT